MAEQNQTVKVHPGPARDIDLAAWLDGVGFHPADTELKQRAHEAVRLLVALVATHLHDMLPAGRDKSIVFTVLEDVLIRSNRALAIGGGPADGVTVETLAEFIGSAKGSLAALHAVVPYDPRIAAYEAAQRGTTLEAMASLANRGMSPAGPVEPFEYRREGGEGKFAQMEIGLTGVAGIEPEVKIAVVEHDEGENVTDSAALWVDDPEVLESAASYLLTMANQLRVLRAR
jgi:hypothetical protein